MAEAKAGEIGSTFQSARRFSGQAVGKTVRGEGPRLQPRCFASGSAREAQNWCGCVIFMPGSLSAGPLGPSAGEQLQLAYSGG